MSSYRRFAHDPVNCQCSGANAVAGILHQQSQYGNVHALRGPRAVCAARTPAGGELMGLLFVVTHIRSTGCRSGNPMII